MIEENGPVMAVVRSRGVLLDVPRLELEASLEATSRRRPTPVVIERSAEVAVCVGEVWIELDALLVGRLEHDHATTRAAQRLVRRGRDKLGMRHG